MASYPRPEANPGLAWWRDAAISRYNEKTYYLGTFFFANLRRTGAFFVTSSFLILQGKKNVQFFLREQKYLISITPSSQGPASALCLLATTIYHTRHCHSHLTNSANRTQGDTNVLYIYIYSGRHASTESTDNFGGPVFDLLRCRAQRQRQRP